MKFIKNLAALFCSTTILVSCSTLSYSPKVSLDISPGTINKTLRIDKFVDSSPYKDKKNPFLGTSVTNKEAMPNELDLEVTNAITSDFSLNGVFREVSRKNDNPDFVMKGEIKRFVGKSHLNTYAKATFAASFLSVVFFPFTNEFTFYLSTLPVLSWYLGIPISKNTSEIEIQVSLYDKNNNLVGTYSGKSKADVSNSIYKYKLMAIPALTNSTFSASVKQIREQILNDIYKFGN